jgi:hypothetical protein
MHPLYPSKLDIWKTRGTVERNMFRGRRRPVWVQLRRTQYEHMFPLHPPSRTMLDAVGMSQTCHMQTHAPQQKGLFDHLIGAGEQRGRHRQAQRLGGLEIDREFDLRRLLDRQIGWLLTL